MQSIVKKDKVEDWIADYGQIIVDECHHISASSFEQIIRKARHITALVFQRLSSARTASIQLL